MIKLIIISILVLTVPSFNNYSSEDKVAFLAGSEKKAWFLFSKTPVDTRETCRAEHPLSMDNSYIFFLDGTFEFDHGSITEDPDCKQEGCCSDFKNIVGRWELNESQNSLKVVALKANSDNILDHILFDATIDQLNENVLKLRQLDTNGNTLYSYEFHNR